MTGPVIAVVVAAGRGLRFGGGVPKAYQSLCGKPILRYAVESLLHTGLVDAVQVIIHPDDQVLYQQAIQGMTLLPVAFGGVLRQNSVVAGLEAIRHLNPQQVLIHDAARPIVPKAVVVRLLDALQTAPGAVPALSVTDSLVRQFNDGTSESIARDGVMRVQTPQAFHYSIIDSAYQLRSAGEFTDDATLCRFAGHRVIVVEGSSQLQKITTVEDKMMFEKNMEARIMRVGSGYDVHRLIAKSEYGDKPLMICGIEIPYDYTLEGHSDADVGLHAIVDAVLGALGEGDIGEHFPPSDSKWKNADSALFVEHVRQLCEQRAVVFGNVDVTIICEQPKLMSYKQAMRKRVAQLFGIEETCVNIKGKTTERLGFTGRKEGIAAQAVVCLMRD